MKRKHLLFCVLVIFSIWACEKNHPPKISDLNYSPLDVTGGVIITLKVQAVDEDGDPLIYLWTAEEGEFTTGTNISTARWKAPISEEIESYSVNVSVSDGLESVSRSMDINIGKTETGSIYGGVYFSSTSIPISGVTIRISDNSTSTDVEGEFAIPGIPIGDHSLLAVKGGYDSYTKDVTVRANRNTRVVAYMTSQLHSTRISGTVTGDFFGLPKPGLIVVVLNPDGSDSELQTITNSSGYYELLSVPQGKRTLVVMDTTGIVFEADVVLAETEYALDIAVSESREFTDQRDGRTYQMVKIGYQVWMADNLAYLPEVRGSDYGSNFVPSFYVYGYGGTNPTDAMATDNYGKYSVLYNWKAASEACPEGWHLPSHEEWIELTDFLGINAGKQMKSADGWNENGNGDNSSGFSALPGGHRGKGGGFRYLSEAAFFWSSSPNGSSKAWLRSLSYNSDEINQNDLELQHGFSVRCLKD